MKRACVYSWLTVLALVGAIAVAQQWGYAVTQGPISIVANRFATQADLPLPLREGAGNDGGYFYLISTTSPQTLSFRVTVEFQNTDGEVGKFTQTIPRNPARGAWTAVVFGIGEVHVISVTVEELSAFDAVTFTALPSN